MAWLLTAKRRLAEVMAIFTASFAVTGVASFFLWTAWVLSAPLAHP